MAVTPYNPSEPSVQYIKYPSPNHQQMKEIIKYVYIEKPSMPVPIQPMKPLSWSEKHRLEKQARIEAQKQTRITNPQPVKQLLSRNVRIQLNREWKWACKCAKRRGLPLPPKPNMFEEMPNTEGTSMPITQLSQLNAPEPTMQTVQVPTQQPYFAMGYLSDSEYRNF